MRDSQKKIAVKAVLVDIDETIVTTDLTIDTNTKTPPNGNYFMTFLCDMLMERDHISRKKAEETIKNIFRLCVRADSYFAAKVLGLSMDKLWNRSYEWSCKGGVRAYPDAVLMVKNLHKRGFRLLTMTNNGVFGSYPKLLRAGLAFEGGKSYFSVFYGDDSFGDSKSNPEVYARVLKREELSGKEAVMIGDAHIDDFKNARKGGIKYCILVDRSQKENIVRDGKGGIMVNSLAHVPGLLTLAKASTGRRFRK